MAKQALVDDVAARLILQAVHELDFVSGPSTEAQLTGPLTGDSGEAFVHAHSFFQSALLYEDFRASAGHPELIRTEQERRFDAMMAMLREATVA